MIMRVVVVVKIQSCRVKITAEYVTLSFATIVLCIHLLTTMIRVSHIKLTTSKHGNIAGKTGYTKQSGDDLYH